MSGIKINLLANLRKSKINENEAPQQNCKT